MHRNIHLQSNLCTSQKSEPVNLGKEKRASNESLI
jgi:hypothetical protein